MSSERAEARPPQSTRDVTLVIPAHDAARTIGECLDAAQAIEHRAGSRLARIVLVDDASRDGTPELARARGIEVIASSGRGAGAARNAGLRAASTPLVWFVDSDCVAEPEALEILLPILDDASFAGAGGSYGIAPGASLLERLIHEEIMVRHARMGREVDFLATFNVLYRRDMLERLDGFDERYLKGQDAELAFRVLESGGRLGFDRRSVVRHFHADRLGRYLRVQRQQGYWRVALHLGRRGHAAGDSYSGALDHAQPFVALLAAPALVAVLGAVALRMRGGDGSSTVLDALGLAGAAIVLALLAMQLPMALSMMRRAGPAMLAFVALGAVRAVARAVGLAQGVVDRMLGRGPIARAARRDGGGGA